MSRLFESFEKLDAVGPYRHISPHTSFISAMMSAFFVGAETVRIIALIHPHRQVGSLLEEAVSLALWLAFGVRMGQVALERVSR